VPLTRHCNAVGPWHIHYVQSAKTPAHHDPVVLVHGLDTSHRYMRPLGRALEPRHCVYVPDLPGFGKSSKPDWALTVEEMADVLVLWMRHLGIVPAHLIGNSLGCNIIVETCIRHPDAVRRVVLQGPTVAPALRSVPKLLLEWFRNSLREPSTGSILLLDYLDAGPRQAVASFKYQLRHPIEDRLPLVRHAALIVRGTRDPLASSQWIHRCAELLCEGRAAEIEGAGHTANLFAADQLAALARDFFASDVGDAERPDPLQDKERSGAAGPEPRP
jgi:2-hydroxy-6-oxonona-2,4-dienedioate hydrolase